MFLYPLGNQCAPRFTRSFVFLVARSKQCLVKIIGPAACRVVLASPCGRMFAAEECTVWMARATVCDRHARGGHSNCPSVKWIKKWRQWHADVHFFENSFSWKIQLARFSFARSRLASLKGTQLWQLCSYKLYSYHLRHIISCEDAKVVSMQMWEEDIARKQHSHVRGHMAAVHSGFKPSLCISLIQSHY